MGNVSKNAEWALWTSHNGCWKQESCLWVLFGWVWGFFFHKIILVTKILCCWKWTAEKPIVTLTKQHKSSGLWYYYGLDNSRPTADSSYPPTAINKWISYCYWGLSELTWGTANFVCLFRKRTLYKRLVSPQLSTDISLLWNLSVE